MFNEEILQRLMKSSKDDKFNSYGEHTKMTGGIRYKEHPTPEMDFQPDNLFTGTEVYDRIKPRMVGGKVSGGFGARLHGSMVNGLDTRGGSLKSIGKSLKKIGKSVGKVVVPLATDVGKNIVKNIATKQGQAYIEKQLAKYAAEALPVIEETAPLLLAAGRKVGRVSGGMVNDRRSARASLVRKIMKEHGVSLPEASKYIKEHGLEY